MKNIILYFACILLFTACEDTTGVITENGTFSIGPIQSNHDYGSYRQDSIAGPFFLRVDFETLYFNSGISIIPTANAFSYGSPRYVNHIDLASIEVRIDQAIRIDQQEFSAGSNILATLFPAETREAFTGYTNSASLNIALTADILSRCRFTNGLTTFTLRGKNSDCIFFSFSEQVVLHIDKN